MAAHDLHDAAALVRLHRIAQTVDALDGGVGGGIEADGIVRADDVVVDRAGNADDGHAEAGQILRAAERTVAADGDDAVESEQLAGVGGLLLPLLRAEFLAAGGIEHSPAAVDDAAHAPGIERQNIAVNQSVPAAADADALDPETGGGARHGADGRVHAGGVAAGGEHADALDCVFHRVTFFPRFERNVPNVTDMITYLRPACKAYCKHSTFFCRRKPFFAVQRAARVLYWNGRKEE